MKPILIIDRYKMDDSNEYLYYIQGVDDSGNPFSAVEFPQAYEEILTMWVKGVCMFYTIEIKISDISQCKCTFSFGYTDSKTMPKPALFYFGKHCYSHKVYLKYDERFIKAIQRARNKKA